MRTYHKIPIEKINYFAGLLDGEGCVRIAKLPSEHKKHNYDYRGSIQIGMTEESALKWVKKNIGGNYYSAPNKNVKSKMFYNWTLGQAKCPPLLEALLPYLIVKKKQAICFIKFAKTITQTCGQKGLPASTVRYREKCYQEMRKLNKKGV